MRVWTLCLLLAACASQQKIVFHPNADGSPTPPVIVDPKPNAVIIDLKPPITLALPQGTTSAHVDICRDDACSRIFDGFDLAGTQGQAPRELPSGVYFLRASAKVGDRVGKAGPAQRLAIEQRAKIVTRHFVIDGPGDRKAALEALGGFAEKALAFYLDYLHLDAPVDPLTLHYYVTEDGYHFATHKLDADNLSSHGGFTRQTHSYIRWGSRADGAPTNAPGQLEYGTAHELAHQMQFLPGWRLLHRMPPWLVEGSADLLAELALASVYGVPDARVVSFFGRYSGAQLARRDGYLIPVKQFFEAEYKGWKNADKRTRHLFYSEGYTLLRMLADPKDRMHSFLREVWSYTANLDLVIGRRVHAVFGEDAALQQQLEAFLRDAPTPIPLRPDARLPLE